MPNETAFNMGSSNIRYGPGATSEIGMDLADMGAKHVLVVTDPNLSALAPVATVLASLDNQEVDYTLFDDLREPSFARFRFMLSGRAAPARDERVVEEPA